MLRARRDADRRGGERVLATRADGTELPGTILPPSRSRRHSCTQHARMLNARRDDDTAGHGRRFQDVAARIAVRLPRVVRAPAARGAIREKRAGMAAAGGEGPDVLQVSFSVLFTNTACTGDDGVVRVPSPSWPSAFEPQHFAVPFARSAQE